MKNIQENNICERVLMGTMVLAFSIIPIFANFHQYLNVYPGISFGEYVKADLLVFICCLFFIAFGLFIFFSVLYDILSSEKETILFLKTIGYNNCFFVDKKGKKFTAEFNGNIETNKYYLSIIKGNYLEKIIEETDSFSHSDIVISKNSYLADFYTPFIHYSGSFFVFANYFLLIFGLIWFFIQLKPLKYFGILICGIAIYLLIYDFIYKNKVKNNNEIELLDIQNKGISIYRTFQQILYSIILIIFIIMAFNTFTLSNDTNTKTIMILVIIFFAFLLINVFTNKNN